MSVWSRLCCFDPSLLLLKPCRNVWPVWSYQICLSLILRTDTWKYNTSVSAPGFAQCSMSRLPCWWTECRGSQLSALCSLRHWSGLSFLISCSLTTRLPARTHTLTHTHTQWHNCSTGRIFLFFYYWFYFVRSLSGVQMYFVDVTYFCPFLFHFLFSFSIQFLICLFSFICSFQSFLFLTDFFSSLFLFIHVLFHSFFNFCLYYLFSYFHFSYCFFHFLTVILSLYIWNIENLFMLILYISFVHFL